MADPYGPQFANYTELSQIHRWELHLDRQMANGMDGALFLSLMQLEEAAKKAQERLNKLRWHPLREPMGG
jgi:hypothetical protein